jgi:transposase
MHRIPDDIRNAAIHAVKFEGRSAVDVGSQYGISSKSIGGWIKQEVLATGVDNRDSYRENTRLKKENEDYIKIIGELTIVIDRLKKKS